MYNTKKRKHRNDMPNKRNHRQYDPPESEYSYRAQQTNSDPDPSLFIQAHEAELRRGPQAQELARSLEVVEYLDNSDVGNDPHQPKVKERIGSALIQWAGGGGVPSGLSFDEDEEEVISLGAPKTIQAKRVAEDKPGIWVDRYDARLLLDALPEFTPESTETTPGSPSGWSDLPSDSEDTFFFTPGEAEDYRNEKRRRLLDQAHEERVKARLEQDKELNEDIVDDDPWGGSDEEVRNGQLLVVASHLDKTFPLIQVDDAQKELMRRTATHLLSSPNPAQLEMRILANHGADKRFAFLKGRWSRTWRLVKAKLRVEKEETEMKEQERHRQGLGMLAGYDSDSDEGNDRDDSVEVEKPTEENQDNNQDEEAKKEIRRQKAKEWAKQRRLATD